MPPNTHTMQEPLLSELSFKRQTSSFSRCLSATTLTALTQNLEKYEEAEVTPDNAIKSLNCAVQPYAWGCIGSSSLVARMKKAQSERNGDGFELNEDSPYAELWIGTHPDGMSTIGPVSLLDHVRSDTSVHLGEGSDDLSFLLKVLSIEKVLSIQAHPDKQLAEKLHSERPNVYKDDNHKPEMAIALTDNVEGMCGFLPMESIAENLREYPEFAALVNTDAITSGHLQWMFRSYMEATPDLVAEQLEKLLSRLGAMSEHNDTQKLILKLSEQFPGDPGIMAPLLFNHIKLKTGEAFFIGANEPHAYIQGDILECQACSNNVVRAGLTPKLKDVDTLVSMLTYECFRPFVTKGDDLDECTSLYLPPVPDFAVEIINVKPNQTYVMKDVPSPATLLCLSGSGVLCQGSIASLDVGFGSSAFASSRTKVTIKAGEEGLRIARAMSNVHYE